MKAYLTSGMFGKPVLEIGHETDDVKTMLEQIMFWKDAQRRHKAFKIESYDRYIDGSDVHKGAVAVDFGDYSSFIEITGMTDDQKAVIFGV